MMSMRLAAIPILAAFAITVLAQGFTGLPACAVRGDRQSQDPSLLTQTDLICILAILRLELHPRGLQAKTGLYMRVQQLH